MVRGIMKDMGSIKVSVVVPVYDTACYLRKCLDSLVGQTLNSVEVIVVNNDSPDDAAKIIREYEKQYPKVVRGIVCKTPGVSAARNAGIKVATGDYLGFVDSDDYVELDMYEKLYSTLKAEGAELAVCGANKYFSSGEKRYFPALSGSSRNQKKDYVLSVLAPWAVLVKREIVIRNELYFHEGIIYEDAALMPAYVLYVDKIAVVNEALYNYIERSNSNLNEGHYRRNLEDIFVAMGDLRGAFERAGELGAYYDEIEYIHIGSLLYSANNRFMKYKKAVGNSVRVRNVMKENFPNWRKNKYYRRQSFKFRLICNMHYRLQQRLLRLLTGTRRV